VTEHFVEYRLVLEGGGVCRDEVRPIRDADNARRLAAYWAGRVSQSTGQTGRVEFREASSWEALPPVPV
jgi:hypothetical protein